MRASLLLAIVLSALAMTPATGQTGKAPPGALSGTDAAAVGACGAAGPAALADRVAALTGQGWAQADAAGAAAVGRADAPYRLMRLMMPGTDADPQERTDRLARAAEIAAAEALRVIEARSQGRALSEIALVAPDGAVLIVAEPRPGLLTCRLSSAAPVEALAAALGVEFDTQLSGWWQITTFRTGASRFDSVERIAPVDGAFPDVAVQPLIVFPPVRLAG